MRSFTSLSIEADQRELNVACSTEAGVSVLGVADRLFTARTATIVHGNFINKGFCMKPACSAGGISPWAGHAPLCSVKSKAATFRLPGLRSLRPAICFKLFLFWNGRGPSFCKKGSSEGSGSLCRTWLKWPASFPAGYFDGAKLFPSALKVNDLHAQQPWLFFPGPIVGSGAKKNCSALYNDSSAGTV